jgi:hypothetical protein
LLHVVLLFSAHLPHHPAARRRPRLTDRRSQAARQLSSREKNEVEASEEERRGASV